MEKCYTAQEYTTPSLCFDLMEIIGQEMEIIRHNLAVAAHKQKYTQILNWITIDNPEEEYEYFLREVDANGGAPDFDKLLTPDEVDVDYILCQEDFMLSWAGHCMEVRSDNGLLRDQICRGGMFRGLNPM